MNRIKLILVLLLPLFCHSQDTTEIVNYYDNKKIREVFTISLPDSSKNGSYKRFYQNGNLWVTGFFENNKRKGLWEFYETLNSPFDCIYKFNYSTHEIIFRKFEDRHPDFIGGLGEFYYVRNSFVKENMKELNSLKGENELLIHIRIDKKGIPDTIVIVPDTIPMEYALSFPEKSINEFSIAQYEKYYKLNKDKIEFLKSEIMKMPVWFEYEKPAEKSTWIKFSVKFD